MSQVRNKVLSLTRNVIPYVKELRVYTDSVVGCILMQQLDYWFARYPEGFYKFLEPSDHAKYVAGQSWQEELGISLTEFRTAFDRIGVRWKSKTEFEAAQDKFQGKFYASYQDKRSNLTFYLRNHELVDTALGELINGIRFGPSSPGDEDSSCPGTKETQSPVGEGFESLGVRDAHLQEIRNPQLNNTENTNTEITQRLLQPATESDAINVRLIYPRGMIQEEVAVLSKILAGLDSVTAQQILDEISGLRKVGKIKSSCAGLAMELKKRCVAGSFLPSAGIGVAAERTRADQVSLLAKPKGGSNSVPKQLLKDRLKQAGVRLHYPGE